VSRIREIVYRACALAVGLLVAAAHAAVAQDLTPLRFGISAPSIAGINRTDATASLKVWIETIGREHQVPVDANPRIIDRLEDFAAALDRGEIDVLTASAGEFLELERVAPLASLFSTTAGGTATEEYVVLVRADSPHRDLADLRGARLLKLVHPSASLAPIWLEVELARANLPEPSGFFRDIVTEDKVNRVILPVFFGRADACLVTRRGFATVGELNPQVAKQLRVLASSPPLIPNITSHRRDIPETLAQAYRRAALSLADTPAGRQVLNLFQNDGFVEISEQDLAPTRALLAERARLSAGSDGREGAP